MKPLCTIALLITTVSTLSAQTVPPALLVREGDRSVPLGLAQLRTEVRIVGAVAETTTTMTFFNPLSRVMEGELYFPLPEGATVSRYALDINGTMVDGVAVEKHEARRVFEELSRRRIDPGLVEWTQGNNFHTRVYPIPAGGTRTVRVGYVTELGGERKTPTYHLPLPIKNKFQEFFLRVEVVRRELPPKVIKTTLANFRFEKWRDSYVAEAHQRDWQPTEDLVISLPRATRPPVVVEKAGDGQVYFAVEADAQPPAPPPPPLASVKRVVVFWDASGSRAGDHQREIGVLKRILAARVSANASHTGSIAVDVVLVRNTAAPPLRLRFSKSALTAALEAVHYDGGTQLGAIAPPPGAEKPDMYLLFTDGLSTFGREDPAPLDAPLYVFSASPQANHVFLESLAAANGGRYFNLSRWKDADVSAQVGRPLWSFLSASIRGGEVRDLYPQLAQPLANRFLLAGKLAADEATVTVRLGVAGGPSQEQSFTVSRADAIEGSLLQRLWAQKKLAELSVHATRNAREIAALGRQFGLVTPFTSLLVLDTLEQYVRYEIAPPKSLTAMREQYLRQVDTLEHQKQKEKGDKLAEVLRMWQERVTWWNTPFKYRPGFKYTGKPESPGALWPRSVEATRGVTKGVIAPSGRRQMGQAMGGMGGAMGRREATAGGLAPHAAVDPSSVASAKEPAPTTEGPPPGRDAVVVIKAWNPETPYLKELQATKKAKGNLWAAYMTSRDRYGASPAFFLDCADFFRESGDSQLALQVLSNIAELELEEPTLLRVLGNRLEQIGQLDLAVQTFEQVLELRPEEPQSYRDLALVLARRAEEGSRKPESILADYARAVDLLAQVVMRRWDGRFPEIEVTALEEVNRILPRAKAAGVSTIPLDPRLIKLLDCDVRIVMTWQADNTDIDLWVTEPSGEKAYYGHNRTTIGGLVSCDFTQGYGPEEYLVRRAAHGMYKIDANYFGTQATRLLGPVTVQADVFTNYGRPNEQRKSLTLRLKDAQETVRIGEIKF